MIQYSDEQEKALESRTGNNMVLAGPGAGKSTMLQELIRRAIQIDGVDVNKICVLSFSNAGKDTMAAKLDAINIPTREYLAVTPNNYGVFNKTIDGLFYQILAARIGGVQNILRVNPSYGVLNTRTNTKSYNMKDGMITKEQYAKRCVRSILKQEYGKNRSVSTSDKVVSETIMRMNNLKSSGITADMYDKLIKKMEVEGASEDKLQIHEMTYKAYIGYDKIKHEKRQFDFSDIPLFMMKLINNHPDVLAIIQNAFDMYIIDEFQDTSQMQFDIIDRISTKDDGTQNMFMIGDPNQSIYGWRGAKADIMINIDDYLENVKRHKFTMNYRSEPHIVKAVSALTKYLETGKISFKPGIKKSTGVFTVEKYINQKTEGSIVAADINKNIKAGKVEAKEVAIVYRTNAQSMYFETALDDYNIPYRVSSGATFWQDELVQKLLAMFEIYQGGNCGSAFRKVANFPDRGLNKKHIDIIVQNINRDTFDVAMNYDYRQDFGSGWVAENINKQLIKFYNSVKSVRDKHKKKITLLLHNVLEDIYTECGIEENIQNMENGFIVEDTYLTVRDYLENENFSTLKKFMSFVKMKIKRVEDAKNNPNSVYLVTGHTSKGLEFDTVYVTGVNEGKFPSAQVEPKDYMDERNLFFVAISRAKKNLHVSYFDRKGTKITGKTDASPSPFLFELVPKKMKQLEMMDDDEEDQKE